MFSKQNLKRGIKSIYIDIDDAQKTQILFPR